LFELLDLDERTTDDELFASELVLVLVEDALSLVVERLADSLLLELRCPETASRLLELREVAALLDETPRVELEL
jgi:hypothetical protein